MALTDTNVRNAEFLISEANNTRSRESVTVRVAANTVLQPGTVLGIVTASGKYEPRAQGGGDGNQTAKGILYERCDNSQNDSAADFKRTVIVRDAEVQGEKLDANDGVAATVLSELTALGLIVRGTLGNTA